MVLNKSLA